MYLIPVLVSAAPSGAFAPRVGGCHLPQHSALHLLGKQTCTAGRERGAVSGCRRVGRLKEKDDNFISDEQVGPPSSPPPPKRMDGSWTKWKWIVRITGSDRKRKRQSRWERNGMFFKKKGCIGKWSGRSFKAKKKKTHECVCFHSNHSTRSPE